MLYFAVPHPCVVCCSRRWAQGSVYDRLHCLSLPKTLMVLVLVMLKSVGHQSGPERIGAINGTRLYMSCSLQSGLRKLRKRNAAEFVPLIWTAL